MAYALHREIDDRELFVQDEIDTAACPQCEGETVKLDDDGHPTCGECGAPLFVNEDPSDGDDEEENRDSFADYIDELEAEMGDGDE